MFTYLYSTERIASKKSKGEVLLFQRGYLSVSKNNDIESSHSLKVTRSPKEISTPAASADLPREISNGLQRQTAVFQWKNISLDLKVKKQSRRILDHVDGWVKPGSLTALIVRRPNMNNEIAELISIGTFGCWKDNPARRSCGQRHYRVCFW